MMLLPEICAWIEGTRVATAIRQSTWLFPTVETIHVLAIVIVVGSVTMLDLRLLGVASKDRSIREVHEEIMPWTWGAFAVAVVAGALLFSSAATKYYVNFPFRMKMLLLLIIGINAGFFEMVTYRRVENADKEARVPASAKIAGAVGIVLWIGVVAFGRWIGFTK